MNADTGFGMSLLHFPICRLDGTPATVGLITGGRPALLVNVASQCGLTSQYGALEVLHERYADRGFTVVGLPCNQFGGQEPGTPEEIAGFCSRTYGVTFPLTEKVEVNGEDRHPIYAELVNHADEAGATGDIRWNFEKFLLSSDGRVVARFRPIVEPDDDRIIAALETLLSGTG